MSESQDARERWLQERNSGIGASDAAVVLGISPWKSAFALWAEKTGLVPSEDIGDRGPVKWGNRLERAVAEGYALDSGRAVEMWPAFQIVRAEGRPYVLATPDAVQESDRGTGLLQVKTAGPYVAAQWKDGPPLYYQVQVQQELLCSGFAWGTLAVLFGGQRLEWWDIERNDAFIDALLPQLDHFWRLVETRTPPATDSSFATAQILGKLYPDDDGSVVEINVTEEEVARRLFLKDRIKEDEEELQGIDNKIKAAIGSATVGIAEDGTKFSLKTQTRKAYAVKESSFRVLRTMK